MKKFSSILISAVLCSSTLTAIPTNASILNEYGGVGYQIKFNSEEYNEFLNEFEEVDYSGLEYLKDYKIFKLKNHDSIHYIFQTSYKSFSFNAISEDSKADIDKVLEEFASLYNIEISVTEVNPLNYKIIDNDKNQNTLALSRKVCDALKKDNLISDFTYHGDYTGSIEILHSYYLTSYIYNDDSEYEVNHKDVIIEKLEQFISDNNLDCSVICADKAELATLEVPGETIEFEVFTDSSNKIDCRFREPRICVVPNDSSSETNLSEIAMMIENQLGSDYFHADWYIDQSLGEESFNLCDVDIFNTKYADVNQDDIISISDSVAVSAFISNSNKNQLSEQAIINADVHDTGNGLNASDSLMIQQYATGKIDSLS